MFPFHFQKLGGQKKTQKKDVTVESINKPCPPAKPPAFNFLLLNNQCFLKVFRYLSISDLFALCEIRLHLKELICESVINERLINFDELPDISYDKVFAMFGKYMVKMKIGEKNVQNVELNHSKFDEILLQIQKHCNKDGLRHVQFECCESTTIISEAVLNDALPFLRNIESFEMNESMSSFVNGRLDGHQYILNKSVNTFIDSVLVNALQIKSIKFQHFRVNGSWLALDHMKNIETLSFTSCNFEKNPCLITFMQKMPALISFTWLNSSVDRVNDSANFVLGLVGNNLPNLKVLNFIRNPDCLEKNVYVAEKNRKPINHEFLVQLKNLKELAISFECQTNLPIKIFDWGLNIQHLRILADHNCIEKLSFPSPINWYSNNNYNLSHFVYLRQFTNLKCVKISKIRNYNMANATFYGHFLSNLPNLKELILGKDDAIWPGQLYPFLQSAKKISILKLEAPASKFSTAVYSNILKMRMANLIEEPSEEPLRVYIDKSPMNEFIEKLKRKYKPNIVSLVPYNYK